MKDFNKILGLVSVIVVLLIVAVVQSHIIVQQEERLRNIKIIAQHEQVVNPWVLIEMVGDE